MLCNRIDKLIVVLFKVFSLSLKVWSFLINICELILSDLVLSPSSPQHEDDEQGRHVFGVGWEPTGNSLAEHRLYLQ